MEQELVQFLRPFRLMSPSYQICLAKGNPVTCLGEEDGIPLMQAVLTELREICIITSGGSLNIIFDRFQKDFGTLGAQFIQ